MGKIKIELAAEISRLRKSSSVWFAGFWSLFFLIGPSIIDTWNQLPQEFKDSLPHGTARYLAGFSIVSIFIARIVRVRLDKTNAGDRK